MVFLFIKLHLLRSEGAEAVLGQSADKECAEDTAVSALDAAVKLHAHANAVIVADDGDGFSKGIADGDEAAYEGLHFLQAVYLLLVWGYAGLYYQNVQMFASFFENCMKKAPVWARWNLLDNSEC